MKIKNIKVNRIKSPQENNARPFVGRPGKLLLQIETDDGVTGIAEAGRNLKIIQAYLDEL